MKKNLRIQSALYYAQVLKDLASILTPHQGQILVGREVFYNNKKLITLECGRKWGKTEFVLYCLYRCLLTFFTAPLYYFVDYSVHATELLWDSGRLPNYLPPELKDKYQIRLNNTDHRVICGVTNSFIKIDGTENWDRHRGTNPKFAVLDEAKDARREFYRAYAPNLLPNKAPMLVVGSPPETDDPENAFNEIIHESKIREDGVYFNQPTEVNPHVDRQELIKIRTNLITMGREAEWLREYMALRVKDETTSIFPMLDRRRHTLPHNEIIAEIKSNKKIIWQCVADPAARSVFGVLFRAVCPITKVRYRVAEIYEKVPAEMTTRRMWDKIWKKIHELHPKIEEWQLIYDEAEAWFANEMADVFEEEQVDNAWIPTEKSKNKKEAGINMQREQMISGKFIMSYQCTNLYWELDNYKKDKHGRIPKGNDHLIDCDRYGDSFIDLGNRREPEPPIPEHIADRRAFTIEEDVQQWDIDDNLGFDLGLDDYE